MEVNTLGHSFFQNLHIKVNFMLSIFLILIIFSPSINSAQTIDLQELIGDTLVIRGKAQLYHMKDINMKSYNLKEGDLIRLNKIGGNWLGITVVRSNVGKWLHYDQSKKNTYSFEIPDKEFTNFQNRLTNLERKVTALETNLKKLEKGTIVAIDKQSALQASSINENSRSRIIKPSDQEIENAIKDVLKKRVPGPWVGNLMGGRNANLSNVRVLEIGNYNLTRKYWPMRIQCVGTCQLTDPFNQGKTIKFDQVGDFLLFQDDYGQWKAEMKESHY